MSNVIPMTGFKPKQPDLCWECSCGCQLFYIVASRISEEYFHKCYECGHKLELAYEGQDFDE